MITTTSGGNDSGVVEPTVQESTTTDRITTDVEGYSGQNSDGALIKRMAIDNVVRLRGRQQHRHNDSCIDMSCIIYVHLVRK